MKSMQKLFSRENLKTFLIWNVGAFITAVGAYFFKYPNHFSFGGVSGITVVLGHYFPELSLGGINWVLNLALLVLGAVMLGKSFGVSTAYVTVSMSAFLSLFEVLFPMSQPLTDQPLLELIFGVLLPSVGAAVLFNVGASTGGTDAILEVVKDLPATTPGIVIVQHMPPVFTQMYAQRLDRICKMRVKEAAPGDRVVAGQIIIGAGGFHLRLARDARGYFVTSVAGPKVNGHCPSVDVLFDSVAETAGRKAIGVILTGMGADGAKGLLRMRKAGAYTIGQDKESSVVYGMPMVAYDIGAVEKQLPLNAIDNEILRQLSMYAR